MTIPAQRPRKIISGSGWSNPLAHDYPIENVTDVKVFADSEELTLGVHYSVSGVGDPTGYTVNITDPGDWSPEVWVLDVQYPINQPSDVDQGGQFGARFEAAIDRMARSDQVIYERALRSVAVSRTTPLDVTVELPAPTPNTLIGWNSDGSGIENKGTIPDIQIVAGHLSQIDTVSAHIDAVDTVASVDSEVVTVAGIAGSVATVAGVAGSVVSAAANETNINAVAAIDSEVVQVANIDAEVAAVAGISADVATVAANIGDVLNAAENAQIASDAAGAAVAAKNLAVDAQGAAETAATNAGTSEGNAATSATDADTARIAAEAAAAAAQPAPIGSVIMIYGDDTSVAPGYLLMSGFSVTNTYPDLRAHGLARGWQVDGNGDPICPDMGGYFPRGWKPGQVVDSGRVFGSVQNDSVGPHRHGLLGTKSDSGATSGNTISDEYVPNGGAPANSPTYPLLRTQNSGENIGSETRPYNRTFTFWIKAYAADTDPGAIDLNGVVNDTNALKARVTALEQKTPYVSPEQAIVVNGAFTLTHGLGVEPSAVELFLICKTAELGYTVGQKVRSSGMEYSGGTAGHGPSIICTSTQLIGRFGNTVPFVQQATSGGYVGITAANWRLIVKAIS